MRGATADVVALDERQRLDAICRDVRLGSDDVDLGRDRQQRPRLLVIRQEDVVVAGVFGGALLRKWSRDELEITLEKLAKH